MASDIRYKQLAHGVGEFAWWVSCALSLLIASFTVLVTLLFYHSEPSYYFPHVPYWQIETLALLIIPILFFGRLIQLLCQMPNPIRKLTEYERHLRLAADSTMQDRSGHWA